MPDRLGDKARLLHMLEAITSIEGYILMFLKPTSFQTL